MVHFSRIWNSFKVILASKVLTHIFHFHMHMSGLVLWLHITRLTGVFSVKLLNSILWCSFTLGC